MSTIQEYDIVALTEDIQSVLKETEQPIVLKRGQVGTVLMTFEDESCLIDFTDVQGTTYAMETVQSHHLMLLVYSPTLVHTAS